jgi:hypothetical protein
VLNYQYRKLSENLQCQDKKTIFQNRRNSNYRKLKLNTTHLRIKRGQARMS